MCTWILQTSSHSGTKGDGSFAVCIEILRNHRTAANEMRVSARLGRFPSTPILTKRKC